MKIGELDNIKTELSSLNDLRIEIKNTEEKIKKMENEKIIVAAVDGSMKDYPYTKVHQKIYAQNKKYIDEVNKYLDLLKERKLSLMLKLNKIESFIDKLPTSRLRLIFEYRYIKQYTWRKIAYKLGNTSEDSVRMEHDRFFKKD